MENVIRAMCKDLNYDVDEGTIRAMIAKWTQTLRDAANG